MTIRIVVLATVLAAFLCTAVPGMKAAAPSSAPYQAVEVGPFVGQRGVSFPLDYQTALAEDIAREISLAFPTVIIVRHGDPAPNVHAVLRIAGVVTRFKAGNRAKRSMIGFGAGATVVRAQVWFTDGTTGQILLNREVQGITWTGVGGGDSRAAGESLAKKLAKFCNSAHLVESN
jgi:hypothetical protein